MNKWVIVIQNSRYYFIPTNKQKLGFGLGLAYNDWALERLERATVFENCSKEDVEAQLDTLPHLKYSKCMRKVVAYEEAEQEYKARLADEMARDKRYNDLLLLAEKEPDTIMVVEVTKPFVGTLRASAKEVIKVITSKWFDFESQKDG